VISELETIEIPGRPVGVCAGRHTNIKPSTSLEMARFTGQLTAYGFVPSLSVTIDSVRPTFVIQGDSRLRGMKQDSKGDISPAPKINKPRCE
jgi:hypothetical protein